MEFSCALGIGKIDDSLSNLVNPRTKNKISCRPEISVVQVQTSLAASIYFYPRHDEKFDLLHAGKTELFLPIHLLEDERFRYKSPSFS